MDEKKLKNIEAAKRLRQSMDAKHMSATDLSKASGVGKSDISNYLKGKYRPKSDKIVLLAAALDVDPTWLNAIDFQMDTHEKEEKKILRSIDEQLVSVLNGLSPDGIQKVLDYARLVSLGEQKKE
jgi:transcriptional regulator with XRE-family HTH domain